MYTHFIIMGSSYSKGYRIAMDYLVEDTSTDFIQSQLDRIRLEVGNLYCVSIRTIVAQGKEWYFVVEADSFFKGVYVYNNIDEFIEELKSNLELSSLDIAKYILSKKMKCDHLKLEKLVYLCHADYLSNFKVPLFRDDVYAFEKGPVCEDTYQTLKKYPQYCCIEKPIDKMPIRSRILSSKEGLEKLQSIDLTLKKYQGFKSDELVNITHSKNSPWFKCYIKNIKYKKIPNDIIIEFHKNEIPV